MKTARILIADDHALFRRGVRDLLDARNGWTICGEAGNGREAVELALSTRPDLVILDISMPELNGLEAAKRILRECPATRVLILTIHESEALIHELLDAGAHGYLLKTDAGEELTQAVEAILDGKPYFTSKVSRMVLEGYRHGRPGEGPRPTSLLTPREREVVQLVAEGKSTKEVATSLGIAVKTADAHRTNAMRKLGLHSTADLVHYAVRNHLIQIPH